MSEVTSSPEFYFDIDHGSLIVGKIALDSILGSNPERMEYIVSLSSALTDPEIAVPKQDPLDVTDWTRQDHVVNLQWLNGVVQAAGRSLNTATVLKRAYNLGISPSVRRMDRLGSNPISSMYKEANIRGYKRGLYDEWTAEDFVSYVSRIALKTPKSASLQDALNERSRANEGPSRKVIARRFGTLSNLLELAGLFGKGSSADPERCIDWGVSFMKANDGLLPNGQHLYKLSPLRLSPTRRSIYDHFGSLPAFQELVAERYEVDVAFEKFKNDQLLWSIKQGVEENRLPESVFGGDQMDTDKIVVFSKWEVANDLLRNPSPDQLELLAKTKSTAAFTTSLRKIDPAISVAEIELSAAKLDVFEWLWPMTDHQDRLKIT